MMIKRLTATFGRLNNETLTLTPGLNILQAPNESGKSTWCAFLRAMFYGVSTSDRDKQGYLSDKTRYRPWSGAPMEGEMELSSPEYGNITITRTGSVKTPMRDFRAVYTGTGEPVPGITGDNAGEALTGVSEQVFSRSAFIAQSGIKIGNTPELEKRISALVSTGDETTSYTEADERLRTWLRRRRFNKSGEIPALELQLAELVEKLERLDAAAEHTSHLRQELHKIECEAELLESELSYYAALDAAAARENAAAAKRRLDEAAAVESELRQQLEAYGGITAETLSDYRGELSALSSLRVMLDAERLRRDGAEAEFDAKGEKADATVFDSASIDRATKELAKLTLVSGASLTMKRLLPVVSIAFILLAVFTRAGILRFAAAGAAILAAVLLAAVLVRDHQQSKRLRNLLAGFGTGSLSELYEKLDEQAALLTELERLRDALIAAERVLQNTEALYDTACRTLTRKLPPNIAALMPDQDAALHEIAAIEDALREYARVQSEKLSAGELYNNALLRSEAAREQPAPVSPDPRFSLEETEAELKRVAKELDARRSEYDMAFGAQRALGDPVVLRSGKNELEARLRELYTQYDALALAIDALGRANTELQTRFSPLLSSTAEKYFSKLTGGKYEKLVFDKSLGASAKTPDDPVSRDALSLSLGAADQIYLALRLAVCTLVLGESPAPCPLILDDALVSFDDTRLKYALRLLLELSAEHRQVLLLTCHDREATYAKELSQNVNIITQQH